MKLKNKQRGALTVEAVIAFSVFISFMFLLLSMVKISLVKITLENAVQETAKYIATSSYPIGIFNDIAEENNQEVTAYVEEYKITKDVANQGISTYFDILFAETEAHALKSDGAGVDEIFKILKKSGINVVKEIVFTGAQNLISKGGTKLAGNIISEVVDSSYVDINKENLTVLVAKLPMPKHSYQNRYNAPVQLEKLGLSKNDFNEDDVVIGVEYYYPITLPFLTTVDVVIHEVAVEHAWVNGGAGNVTVRTEGFKLDEWVDAILGKTKVYITKTGKKYHKEDCYYLWNGKQEVRKNAIRDTHTPCSKCCP